MATAVIVIASSNYIIDFNEVDIRSFIYPKVIIHRGRYGFQTRRIFVVSLYKHMYNMWRGHFDLEP